MYQLNDIDEEYKPRLKRAAAKNAATRNKSNEHKASAQALDVLEGLYKLVNIAYIRSRLFKNFNVHTMTIKVDHPCRADVITADRDTTLATYCLIHNINKRTVGTNVIYHVPYETMQ